MRHVDPTVLLVCPELIELMALMQALNDAVVSLDANNEDFQDPASLLLVALLEEISIAVRSYHEMRVESAETCLPF